MSKARLKKNDQVVVVSGAERGKRGKVLDLDLNKNLVLVEGINKKVKFYRDQQDKSNSGLVEIERPFNASNVMPFCDSCKKGVRINVKDKARVCTKCGKSLD